MEINRRTLLAGSAALAALPAIAGKADAGVATSEMPAEGVILTAAVKAKPGQEEAVKAVLLALVEPVRKEPGCLCYNLHQAKADKGQFLFYEQWASQAALDAHGKMPYMKALHGKLEGLTEKGVLTFYELLK
jgi:quinol monooxygenase YgiN